MPKRRKKTYEVTKKTNKREPLTVMHVDSITNTLRHMPKYNGHAIGHGVHGDVKYNRRKTKEETRRIIEEE